MIRKEKIEELQSYIEELKTIKKEINNNISTRFISSVPYLVTLNNGRVIPREQILKNKIDGSAVIIVPKLKDSDEYLIVVEPRVFTKLGVGVSFPAGYIDEGENPEYSATRELREETGCVAERLFYLDSFYQDQGISGAYNHLYLALNCEKKFDQNLGKNEIIKYMSLTMEELDYIERERYMCGMQSKLALCRIKNYKGGK